MSRDTSWRARATVVLIAGLTAAALGNVIVQGWRGATGEAVNGRVAVMVPTAAGPAASSASAATAANVPTIRDLQRELVARGYETGATDGALTLATRAAVMAWEHDRGLPLTAEPTEALLRSILLGSTREAKPGASPEAERLTRSVQAGLHAAGHSRTTPRGLVSGRLDAETVLAIKAFELSERMPATGRISGSLVLRLERLAASGRLGRPK